MKRSGTLNKKRKMPAYIRSPSPRPPGNRTTPPPHPPSETSPASKSDGPVTGTSKEQNFKLEQNRPKFDAAPSKMATERVPLDHGHDGADDVEPMEVEVIDASIRSPLAIVTEAENPHSSKNNSLPQVDHPPKPLMSWTSESQLAHGNAARDVMASLSRKRTPSPTQIGPPAKRQNVETVVKLASSDAKSSNNKMMAPVVPPRLSNPGLSSASKVLHEEFRRKLSQDNSKLKQMIFKEIRKHSKSEFVVL